MDLNAGAELHGQTLTTGRAKAICDECYQSKSLVLGKRDAPAESHLQPF